MAAIEKLKVATWNVNSLRVRLPYLLQWLQDNDPDIVALQETKLTDEQFPLAPLQSAGYQCAFTGQKTYNGVATLSKHPITTLATAIPEYSDPQKRVLLTQTGPLAVLNVYIPNGASLSSDKYQYKLTWLKNLQHWLTTLLATHPRLIMLGDFNIAPTDIDVHDPVAWQGKVLVSEPERAAFETFCSAGLSDCLRKVSQSAGEFSWWDYRAAAFRRGLGMRIDHILASSVLATECTHCYIDKVPRRLERPSDHTPVVAEFATAVAPQ